MEVGRGNAVPPFVCEWVLITGHPGPSAILSQEWDHPYLDNTRNMENKLLCNVVIIEKCGRMVLSSVGMDVFFFSCSWPKDLKCVWITKFKALLVLEKILYSAIELQYIMHTVRMSRWPRDNPKHYSVLLI